MLALLWKCWAKRYVGIKISLLKLLRENVTSKTLEKTKCEPVAIGTEVCVD